MLTFYTAIGLMITQSSLRLTTIFLALGLQLGMSASLPALASSDKSLSSNLMQRDSENLIAQFRRSRLRFKVPNVRSSGNLRGGAARGSCNAEGQKISITPLIPSKPTGQMTNGTPEVEVFPAKTVHSHPKFLVNIPPTTAKEATFLLVKKITANQDEVVYEEKLPLTGEGGIMSFEIPTEKPGLETGQTYKWSLGIVCDPSPDANPYIEGVVERVALPPELAKIETLPLSDRPALYVEHDLWYDAVDSMAQLRLAQPNNPTVQADWQELLNSVNLGAIANEPLVK